MLVRRGQGASGARSGRTAGGSSSSSNGCRSVRGYPSARCSAFCADGPVVDRAGRGGRCGRRFKSCPPIPRRPSSWRGFCCLRTWGSPAPCVVSVAFVTYASETSTRHAAPTTDSTALLLWSSTPTRLNANQNAGVREDVLYARLHPYARAVPFAGVGESPRSRDSSFLRYRARGHVSG